MRKLEAKGGMKIVVSEAVAPDEVVLLGSADAVRWTPDERVERLSVYQADQIRKAVEAGAAEGGD